MGFFDKMFNGATDVITGPVEFIADGFQATETLFTEGPTEALGQVLNSFQEEILYMCRSVGCRFREVPITFEDRRAGTSKINWKESVMALWIIFRLALDRLTRRRVRIKT